MSECRTAWVLRKSGAENGASTESPGLGDAVPLTDGYELIPLDAPHTFDCAAGPPDFNLIHITH